MCKLANKNIDVVLAFVKAGTEGEVYGILSEFVVTGMVGQILRALNEIKKESQLCIKLFTSFCLKRIFTKSP